MSRLVNRPRLLPSSRMQDFTPPAPALPLVEGSHETNWVRAIQEDGKAGADFAYSGPLTETCLPGNVATRVNGKIAWNGEGMQVTSIPEANRYVRAACREGWEL